MNKITPSLWFNDNAHQADASPRQNRNRLLSLLPLRTVGIADWQHIGGRLRRSRENRGL